MNKRLDINVLKRDLANLSSISPGIIAIKYNFKIDDLDNQYRQLDKNRKRRTIKKKRKITCEYWRQIEKARKFINKYQKQISKKEQLISSIMGILNVVDVISPNVLRELDIKRLEQLKVWLQKRYKMRIIKNALEK